jgi:hypothetical protein
MKNYWQREVKRKTCGSSLGDKNEGKTGTWGKRIGVFNNLIYILLYNYILTATSVLFDNQGRLTNPSLHHGFDEAIV